MTAAELYLTAGAILFCAGIFVVITRRNAIMALIGIELMMNAANLNFVAFNRMHPDKLDGQATALFVIVIAAAEIAVALAIVLNVYKQYKTINLDEIDNMRS